MFFRKNIFVSGLCVFCLSLGVWVAFAQQAVSPVEINGDNVEFDVQRQAVIATGNVIVTKGNVRLLCDRLEYDKSQQIAKAIGHVVLEQNGQRVEGEDMVYNFETMKADFDKPLLTAPPIYGSGDSVQKVGDNHFQIHKGYFSTCDFDRPQSRAQARVIDVYPQDKAVARDVTFRIGNVPVMYLPKYTQDLRDTRSILRVIPGYDSKWGGFLLSRLRFDRNDNFKTFWHIDYRERKDLAWGVDGEYKTPQMGTGVFRTYYMNERNISSDRIWGDRASPTIERERYKAEWRHKWQIDDNTFFISQYYKLSDATVLKDYFESEYEEDSSPNSYAILTRHMNYGTVALRADYRVNRFVSEVERLPEVSYSLPSKEILDTGLYFKNKSSATSLYYKNASPTDSVLKTKRVDIDNEVSYPMKMSFLEVRPFVGAQHTFYTDTNQEEKENIVRGVFSTGVDVGTKFYRVFDVHTNTLGLDINELRHVINPSIAYVYQDNPTVEKDTLDQYDAIDALTRIHKAVLSLENKIQTRRDGESVDLVRLILSSEFAFKQDTLPSGYNNMTLDLEVTPYPWLGLYFDTTYNPQTDDLESANFDIYINDSSDIWYLRLGERYHYQVDNQIEAEVGWQINPKWTVATLERFDMDTGRNKETAFSIRRDLHAWLLDIELSKEHNDGESIMFMFSLKGVKDAELGVSTSFGGRRSEKPGAH